MKIKILLFVLGAGLVLASCSDKEAEAKIKQMETDMHKADSTCTADKQMMQHTIDSLTMAATMHMNSMSNNAPAPAKAETPKEKLNVKTKEGATKTGAIDIHKKGGATGGN